MRLGINTSLENYESAAKVGFDYFEPAVTALAQLDEEAFENFKSRVSKTGLPVETACVLFPGEIKLVGETANWGAAESYLKKILARLERLGVKVVVLGSGGSRRIPEGYSPELAEKEFVAAAKKIGDLAEAHGILIALEPINRLETNFLNTVAEGLALVRKIKHPAVKLLADAWHMARENEGVGILFTSAEHLIHAHTAGVVARRFPGTPGENDLAGFFDTLKECGYAGRLTVEAKTEDFSKDAAVSLKYLRGILSGRVSVRETALSGV